MNNTTRIKLELFRPTCERGKFDADEHADRELIFSMEFDSVEGDCLDSHEDICEAFFHATNAPFLMEDRTLGIMQDEWSSRGAREGHYTPSKGDAIIINENDLYLCESVGFRKCPMLASISTDE
jgi:hypothetical protein